MLGSLTVPIDNRNKDAGHETLQQAWDRVKDLIQHRRGHNLV